MFEDIIGKKENEENELGLICCSSCTYSTRARFGECPKDDKKCFHKGENMEYKGWSRFNPVYRYSQWEPIILHPKEFKDETEV